MAIHFTKFQEWQDGAGLTDADVGEIAECSHTTISRYKRGEFSALDPAKRSRICDASGGVLKPGDFADFEDKLVRARERAA